MAEGQAATGSYEEKPKVNWFLYAATGFFGLLAISLIQVTNSWGKWLWLAICVLNVGANVMQINYARSIKYSLWKRGLSIYVGKNREALVRFDKALVFKEFKGYSKARPDMKEFGVTRQLRSFPVFGGRRRWLVIFERDDGENQALVFDPSPMLETMFRDRLKESELAEREREGVPRTPATTG